MSLALGARVRAPKMNVKFRLAGRVATLKWPAARPAGAANRELAPAPPRNGKTVALAPIRRAFIIIILHLNRQYFIGQSGRGPATRAPARQQDAPADFLCGPWAPNSRAHTSANCSGAH